MVKLKTHVAHGLNAVEKGQPSDCGMGLGCDTAGEIDKAV